jgi:hypothetical protein
MCPHTNYVERHRQLPSRDPATPSALTRGILVCAFLFAANLRAATYVVTPGGTYKTFYALMAAKTLKPGDSVEFEASTPGGTFDDQEPSQMMPNGSGTASNLITILGRAGDHIIIDGAYRLNCCLAINSLNYITISNLTLQNSTGLAGACGCVTLIHANNINCTNCVINVGFADVATANTNIERCGVIQGGSNFTMTGCTITIGPGLWGSQQTDCFDLGCNVGYIHGCTFNMLNACYGLSGGLDSSGAVVTGGTAYKVGDVLAVSSDLTTNTSSGSYGEITVTSVSNGAVTHYTVLHMGANYFTGHTYKTVAQSGNGSGCEITVANVPSNHNDCLQLLNCTNTTVDGCIMNRNVSNSLTSTSGQGIISEYYNGTSDVSPQDYGYATFTNNLIYGNFGSNGITINSRHENGCEQCGIANVTFANNTIDTFSYVSGSGRSTPINITFDSGNGGIWSGGSLVLENNIFVNRNSGVTYGGGISIDSAYGAIGQAGDFGAGTPLGAARISNNHVYFTSAVTDATTKIQTIPSTSTKSNIGTAATWSMWQSAGYDLNGLGWSGSGWKNPEFVDYPLANYELSAMSPDIGAGIRNAYTPPKDLADVIRYNPTSIGAFEFSGNVSATIPTISNQPVSQTVNSGANVTFSVVASGDPTPAYQWQLNTINIPEATSALLTLNAVTTANDGTYSVVVSNSAGSVTSQGAVLTVSSSTTNTAPVISTQPSSQTVNSGSNVSFSVTANGSPTPSYQWKLNSTNISGATNSTLTLDFVSSANAGTYTVAVTNSVGSVTSQGAVLTVNSPGEIGLIAAAPTPPAPSAIVQSRLINLSVRAFTAPGPETLTAGFVVSGGNKSVLIRGIGPTLTEFGVNGVISDPQLSLFSNGDLLETNSGWGNSTTLANEFAALGAFALPANSTDAAIFTSLAPNSYSAEVTSLSGASGVALLEVYDADITNTPSGQFINLSVRAQVNTGSGVLIVGFVISGDTPVQLLIRAVGPSLSQFGITDALASPILSLYQGTELIDENSGWGGQGALSAAFAQVGAFALTDPNSLDAGMIVTLQPGVYSTVVSGADNTTGIALAEIYLMQ